MDNSFRPIKNYPGYRVSSSGEVESCWVRRGRRKFVGDSWRPLRPYRTRRYVRVGLSKDGRQRPFRVHRLVLEGFIGPCPDGFVACHNDGDPSNNRVENLRWDSPKANSEDARRHGTLYCGEAVRHAKLRAADVLEIRRLSAEGVKSKELATRFGVSRDNIYAIVEGRTWKHLLPLEEMPALRAEGMGLRGAA